MKIIQINNKHKKFLYNLVYYYIHHGLSTKFFIKAYYDYFMDEMPSDYDMDWDDHEFFGDICYYDIDYTIESPSELDRQDGYINYDDFRKRLLSKMGQFEFVLDEHTKAYFSEAI